jgi:hypothetical protein
VREQHPDVEGGIADVRDPASSNTPPPGDVAGPTSPRIKAPTGVR